MLLKVANFCIITEWTKNTHMLPINPKFQGEGLEIKWEQHEP